jgi:hypothetical protein
VLPPFSPEATRSLHTLLAGCRHASCPATRCCRAWVHPEPMCRLWCFHSLWGCCLPLRRWAAGRAAAHLAGLAACGAFCRCTAAVGGAASSSGSKSSSSSGPSSRSCRSARSAMPCCCVQAATKPGVGSRRQLDSAQQRSVLQQQRRQRRRAAVAHGTKRIKRRSSLILHRKDQPVQLPHDWMRSSAETGSKYRRS